MAAGQAEATDITTSPSRNVRKMPSQLELSNNGIISPVR